MSHSNFPKILIPGTLGSQLSIYLFVPKLHTLQGASQSSTEWGAPTAAHHSLSPLAPKPLVPLVSPLDNCVFQKLLPWHFLTDLQNLSQGMVLLFTFVQSFCFYNVLSCPPSHLILINTPSEVGGKGLLLPFYRKETEAALLILQCHQQTFMGLSLTLAQQCSFDTGSRFSFLLTFPGIPVGFTQQARYKYS